MKNSKVLKAGLGYTIGNYLLKGLSFISIPIYTRLLSTSNYGAFNNFLTYESIFFIILGCAIHSSYNSAHYKYEINATNSAKGKDYYTYASTTTIFILISAVIWLFLTNIFYKTLINWLEIDRFSLNLLVIYSAAAALITCFNYDVSINYEYKKFLAVSGFNAISTILISILLLLTLFDHKRYMGMIIGASVPSILASIYVVFYFFKRAKPKNFFYFLKWGLRYSLPIVPNGLSQVVLNQFDRIMITKLVSLAATGIYSFAYNIYSILAVTFNSLDSVWTPWFYKQMKNKNYKAIKKYSSLYICLMFIFTAGVILISPELIMILGQRNYWLAKYTVIPVVAGGYFAFLYTIPVVVEYYYSKTGWIALGTSIAAVVNIVLNWLFIPRFGYIAAAYSTLVTYILYFLFHFFIARKIHGSALFSTKVILACSIGVLFISLLARLFVEIIIIRWLIAISLATIFIVYEEKKYGFIKKKLGDIK